MDKKRSKGKWRRMKKKRQIIKRRTRDKLTEDEGFGYLGKRCWPWGQNTQSLVGSSAMKSQRPSAPLPSMPLTGYGISSWCPDQYISRAVDAPTEHNSERRD